MSAHSHSHSESACSESRENAAQSPRARTERESTPAGVEQLQEEYRRAFARRFKQFIDVLEISFEENDAFQLDTRVNANIDPANQHEFKERVPKQIRFRERIQRWIDEGILEPKTPEQVKNSQHYTAIYVDAAYAQGVSFAEGIMVDRGVSMAREEAATAMGRPIHIRELETVYARNYRGLEGITDDIDRSLSRIFLTALREGWGSSQTATEITNEVESIQHTRARTMARTEIMNAHNSAAARRYQESGIQEVEVLTHNPCSICRALAANDPYPVEQAVGMIPGQTHPNCVCTIAPIV